ncbi:MAG TPA: hypothetical protein VES73_07130, partial [Lamprocystis sp. (in: g-proteobacteria)]|nr:hypothetical protein [Lamprocystis sp. (in: g-proteobacteria)]
MKHPNSAHPRFQPGATRVYSWTGRGVPWTWRQLATAAWLAMLVLCTGGLQRGAEAAFFEDKINVTDAPLYLLKGAMPNLILTLDDSDSMLLAGSGTMDIRELSSATSPIYYDPEIVYLPPLRPDGEPYP